MIENYFKTRDPYQKSLMVDSQFNQLDDKNLYTFNQNIDGTTYRNQHYKQVGGQIYRIDKNNELAKQRLIEHILNRSRLMSSRS